MVFFYLARTIVQTLIVSIVLLKPQSNEDLYILILSCFILLVYSVHVHVHIANMILSEVTQWNKNYD